MHWDQSGVPGAYEFIRGAARHISADPNTHSHIWAVFTPAGGDGLHYLLAGTTNNTDIITTTTSDV